MESTIQGTEISATVTRRGIEETSREPSMRIMKKRVLHALFTLFEPPPLPPPFPAPILLEPPPQQTSFFVLSRPRPASSVFQMCVKLFNSVVQDAFTPKKNCDTGVQREVEQRTSIRSRKLQQLPEARPQLDGKVSSHYGELNSHLHNSLQSFTALGQCKNQSSKETDAQAMARAIKGLPH